MLTVTQRKERITQLKTMIEELQSEDNQFAGSDDPTYESAISNLKWVISYQEKMIEKSTL